MRYKVKGFMTPEFSIVVSFRNRDIHRVKLSLESIAKQTFTSFELIFVDYGSEPEVACIVRKIVETFPFTTYLYSDTRGWFWNRAHALNIGIKSAKGKIILISDIDLILPPEFISKLQQLSFNTNFYTFSCYYLPKNSSPNTVTKELLLNCKNNYVGLCAASKEHLLTISGFDEYYMHWGGEDDDLYARLVDLGCIWNKASIEDFPVLHQWHPVQAPKSPTPWYLEMVTRLYSGKRKCSNDLNDFGVLVKVTDRTVLCKIDNYASLKKLELFPNPTFQFNIFLDRFYKMKSGDFGYFELEIPPEPPKGRKQILIEKLNEVFNKHDISLTFNKMQIIKPLHDKAVWDDFVMYFIGLNRHLMNDYYILRTESHQVMVFQKK